MSTDLARQDALLPDHHTWETMLSMADTLVKSGMLPAAIKTPAAALAIMQKGRELRIPPMYALSNINIIGGKPVASAELMLAMIYRDHGDGAVHFEATDAERCAVLYRRRGWSEARHFEWTIQDAKAANLAGKDVWKAFAPAMLRARCISAVARLAFPDTIGGLYTPEELGAEVTVTPDGEIVTVAPPAEIVELHPAEHAPDFSGFKYPDIRERAAAVAEYDRLARLAVERRHRHASKIMARHPNDCTDGELENAVRVLQRWEVGGKPTESVENAGEY